MSQAKHAKGRGLVHEAPSKVIEWYTPQWIFDGLPIEFDLDPCSPLTGPVTPAKRHLTMLEDGLAQPWRGHVWVNPPYGGHIPFWLDKLQRHGNGIALVYTRTDNVWFHTYSPPAVLFLQGRVKFINSETGTTQVIDPKTGELKDSSPGAPSMLMAYGIECVEALERSTLKGTLMYTWGLCDVPEMRTQGGLFDV